MEASPEGQFQFDSFHIEKNVKPLQTFEIVKEQLLKPKTWFFTLLCEAVFGI